MHQRHVASSCCDHAAKPSDSSSPDDSVPGKMMVPASALTTREKTARRRRRRQAITPSWWPFSSSGSRLAKRSRALNAVDIDLLATLLQIISILIIAGCAVTLLSQSMSNDYDSPSWRQSINLFGWLGSAGAGFVPSPRRYGVGLNAQYPKVPLRPSSYYKIPDAMQHIGDKSDRYALLRKEYDEKEEELSLPEREHRYAPITTDKGEAVPVDIFNCPEKPPEGYPYAWNLLEILKAWPPDDPNPRPEIFQGLCVFDFMKDQAKAYKYREAELPFVVRNDPEVLRTVKRWNDPAYMRRMLGNVRHRAEFSESNHFMYWNPPTRGRGGARKHKDSFKRPGQNELKDWKQPTEMIRMTYEEWLDKANITDYSQLGPDMPHWYFRLIGCGETGPEGQCDNGSSEYLFDELTFFQPKETLYMVDPDEQKGIHCRFGMRGVIAENHFDGSRNAIALLSGERRYILSHPDQCTLLSLLPKGHPSARHSAIDWSNPDLDTYPEFAMAKANEVVMQGK